MKVDAELREQLQHLQIISEQIAEWIDIEIFNLELLERDQLGYNMDLKGKLSY